MIKTIYCNLDTRWTTSLVGEIITIIIEMRLLTNLLACYILLPTRASYSLTVVRAYELYYVDTS